MAATERVPSRSRGTKERRASAHQGSEPPPPQQPLRLRRPGAPSLRDGSGDGIELRPIGEGIIDHRRAVELLLGAGYDGFISGEWINWEPYEMHLPREIATLRRYEEELA